MTTSNNHPTNPQRWKKSVATVALMFGILTIFSGGNVLFGPDKAQKLAGDFLPFIVWFNFLAGFFYVGAAIVIWRHIDWAVRLAGLIAIATGIIALVFVYQVINGTPFEFRTIGALALRTGFWAAVALALSRKS